MDELSTIEDLSAKSAQVDMCAFAWNLHISNPEFMTNLNISISRLSEAYF